MQTTSMAQAQQGHVSLSHVQDADNKLAQGSTRSCDQLCKSVVSALTSNLYLESTSWAGLAPTSSSLACFRHVEAALRPGCSHWVKVLTDLSYNCLCVICCEAPCAILVVFKNPDRPFTGQTCNVSSLQWYWPRTSQGYIISMNTSSDETCP